MRFLIVALLLFGGVAHAGAQTTDGFQGSDELALPTDAELAEFLADPARTSTDAYRLGVRLFEARRYEAAERAWLRAYTLGRDPTLLVAVADMRQRRDDAPGAVAMLQQYLIERPDAPDRASIEAHVAMLLKSPAQLKIRSRESGHAILVDGIPVKEKTPATLEVEPGTHTILVVGDGRQIGEQTVQVGYGEVQELTFDPQISSDVIVEQTEEARLRAEIDERREDQTIRRAVISTGALSAGALVTGTVLGVLALKKERAYQNNPDARTADQEERFTLFANLSFGLAALSAITSFTLFMTHKNKRKPEREAARVRIEPRGAGASATIRF